MDTISKQKSNGQVFTPDWVAGTMLGGIGYNKYANLSGMCFLDNSCGNGAILMEAVKAYIESYRFWVGMDTREKTDELVKRLELDIHGIELDPELCEKCKANLDAVAFMNGVVKNVKWDIRNEDALLCHAFDGKVNFLCCNPPYVRTHNLTGQDKYDGYSFAKEGMTDLYILFYELGFRQLAKNGRMAYITPSSWFTSVAGREMRKYIVERNLLTRVSNFAHRQVFNGATTYVAISFFDNTEGGRGVVMYDEEYGENEPKGLDVRQYDISDIVFGDDKEFMFPADGTKEQFRSVYGYSTNSKKVSVKNGFATLADDVFIADSPNDFGFDSDIIFPVVKASTGESQYMLFPYDRHGDPIPKDALFKNVDLENYFERNMKRLLKGKTEDENPDWFRFGRTQAIKDIGKYKIAVSPLMSGNGKFKYRMVDPFCGVYGGLYVTGDEFHLHCAMEAFKSGCLCEYVKTLGKYKSGGYYTFSSKDLEKYLNWFLDRM